jgi:hypothetical protein
MKEQFVTYEIALELKELGFNEECLFWYNPTSIINLEGQYWRNSSNWLNSDQCTAPLWQQVIDWLREKYDINIDIAKICNGSNNYHFALNLTWEYIEGTYYKMREQAILKAIELVKNNNLK